jgi:hypothetical protein
MASPQKYRDEAQHLRSQAEAAISLEVRRQLLAIADQYERLATSIEATRTPKR